jgi:hypothetical protein
MDPKSRLVRFFEKYNPEKLSTVDQILQSYAGKEAQLFEALVKKYGPEPAAPSPPAATPGSSTDYKSRLTRFFEKYEPSKVSSVDEVLVRYKGKEQQLFEALSKKYGPEPAEAASTPQLAAAAAPATNGEDGQKDQQQNGDAAATSQPAAPEPPKPLTLSDYLKIKKLTSEVALVAICGGPPSTVAFLKRNFAVPFDTRVRRLLQDKDPNELLLLSKYVADAAGGREAEEKVMTELRQKYGPEPVQWEDPKPVKLLSRRVCRPEDEQLSDDDSTKAPAPPPAAPLPEPLEEAKRIVTESAQAPPGDYSGDEAKCYPNEEEYWMRLRFSAEEMESTVAANLRGRAFTEFVRDDDEMSMNSPRSPRGSEAGESGDEADLASPRDPMSPSMISNGAGPTCQVDDRKGRPVGSFCVPCSALVGRAFNALWTPVGPRHRKLISTMQTKNGYLEKLSGGKIGNKWQRRWMKVNDFGIHYFESNKAGEKPKGHKTFTKQSKVIENPSPELFPKCNDPRFYHFAVTVNSTQEPFVLRVGSKQEKDEWVEFLREGLERLKVTMVGQDPNPARWRARVTGLRSATNSLCEAEIEDAKLVDTLRQRKAFLQEQLTKEKDELSFLVQQNADLAIQASSLQKQIEELKIEVERQEKESEVREIDAENACIHYEEQRDLLHAELERAAKNAEILEREVQEIKCRVIDAQVAKAKAEARCKCVYEKWSRGDENAKNNKIALSTKRSHQSTPRSGSSPPPAPAAEGETTPAAAAPAG